MKYIDVQATIENIDIVTNFVNTELKKYKCSKKAIVHIDIIIDEIFGNIAKYAYKQSIGKARVGIEVAENMDIAIITFIDSGKPYNPLLFKTPDILQGADERQIGGLGIFLVKNMVDDISYEYLNSQNILKIKKCIE